MSACLSACVCLSVCVCFCLCVCVCVSVSLYKYVCVRLLQAADEAEARRIRTELDTGLPVTGSVDVNTVANLIKVHTLRIDGLVLRVLTSLSLCVCLCAYVCLFRCGSVSYRSRCWRRYDKTSLWTRKMYVCLQPCSRFSPFVVYLHSVVCS